jgi:hypothetical protein
MGTGESSMTAVVIVFSGWLVLAGSEFRGWIALFLEFRGDIDSDRAKAESRISKRQGELAILGILLQAFEEPAFSDTLHLAKMRQPGFVAFERFWAFHLIHDAFDMALVFLRDFHKYSLAPDT